MARIFSDGLPTDVDGSRLPPAIFGAILPRHTQTLRVHVTAQIARAVLVRPPRHRGLPDVPVHGSAGAPSRLLLSRSQQQPSHVAPPLPPPHLPRRSPTAGRAMHKAQRNTIASDRGSSRAWLLLLSSGSSLHTYLRTYSDALCRRRLPLHEQRSPQMHVDHLSARSRLAQPQPVISRPRPRPAETTPTPLPTRPPRIVRRASAQYAEGAIGRTRAVPVGPATRLASLRHGGTTCPFCPASLQELQ